MSTRTYLPHRANLWFPQAGARLRKGKGSTGASYREHHVQFYKEEGIAGEIRQYKEQKGEAERFEDLCQERVRAFAITIIIVAYMRLLGRFHPAANPIQIVPH